MYIEVIYTEYFSENLVFNVYYKSPRGPFIFYSSKIIFSWNVFFLFCFYRISIEISRNLKFSAISVLLNVFHFSTPFVSVLSPTCSLKCRLRCFHSLNHHVVSPHCFGGVFIASQDLAGLVGLFCRVFVGQWTTNSSCPVLPRLDLLPLHLLEKPFFALPSSTETILTCLKFGLDIPLPVDPVLKTSYRPGLHPLSLCRVFLGLYVSQLLATEPRVP